jgi:predicted  nucleic acid-binding Zn-ribbon protein
VEGKGAGTIQDVTISQAKPSQELKQLRSNKVAIEQGIYRNTQARNSLDNYLGSLSSQQTPSAKLAEIISDYDAALGDLQKKMNGLTEELEEVQNAITIEELKLQNAARVPPKKWNPNLSLSVTVGIFANTDGDVELGLIYGA